MPLNPNCRHDVGFKCAEINTDVGYKFYCVRLCGFFMDYDPALYPEGVCFHKKYALNLKDPPSLRSNEVRK